MSRVRWRLWLLLLLWPAGLWAESLTFAWDVPTLYMDGTTPLTVSYYELSWGTASGVYTAGTSFFAPGSPPKTISGLDPGITYFFAIRAVDAAGARSAYSNEVTGRAGLKIGISP